MSEHNRLISRLASRNIFRNTRRTFLTVLLIACSLSALLFSDALIRGSLQTMVKVSTETFLGQAQIHKPGFRESRDVDIYIDDTKTLYKTLDGLTEIQAYSPRTLSGGMFSSSENVSSGMIIGINPEQEAQVSKLKHVMQQGIYLSGKSSEILIGSELAALLEISLGDRLVVTVSQAHGGELSQALFRISGIFKFGDRTLDSQMVFINLAQGQSLLNIRGVHEVAIKLQSLVYANDKNHALWQSLNNDTWETLSWMALMPQLSGILAMVDYSTWIIATIMFILVSLGLINTMFMSIYERQNEFGILLAIGTRPQQLFWQIILEGGFIGLISVALGSVLGGLGTWWGASKGLNYMQGLEMAGTTFNEAIYLVADTGHFIALCLSILLITIIACIYPAIHAARLTPAHAMRKSL
ncbi:MAG: ABC transporter permease [Pseudomonadales bacterium]|nr:ABC transporter permease [Pseudomonadales bacterium]